MGILYRHDYLLSALPALEPIGSIPPMSKAEFLDRVAGAKGPIKTVEVILLGDDLTQYEAVLSEEITPEQADIAVKTSEVLFGQEISDVSDEMLESIFRDVPSTELPWKEVESGIAIVDAMVQCELTKGKSAARRLINGGGVYLNNKRVTDVEYVITKESLASAHTAVLRTGKKNYHLLKFVSTG